MSKELYNNLVIKGSLVLFNMVAPHGEKPYFVVVESSVRIFVNYLVLQRSDLACLQILLYHAGPALLVQIVSRGMVLRFRKQFAEVTGPGSRGQRAGARCSVRSSGRSSAITRGCTAWRRLYRCTVYSVHSDRLLFFVRPSTVRKFRSP